MARQVKHRDTQQLTTMEQTYEGFFTDFDEDCVDQYKAEEVHSISPVGAIISVGPQRIVGSRQKIEDSHNLKGAGLSVLGTGQTSLANLYHSPQTSQSEQTLPTTRRPTIWDRAVDGILLRSECLVWPDSR